MSVSEVYGHNNTIITNERKKERVKRMVYDHQKAKTNDVKGNEGGGEEEEVWLWPPIQSFPPSLSPRRILPHFPLFFIHSLSFLSLSPLDIHKFKWTASTTEKSSFLPLQVIQECVMKGETLQKEKKKKAPQISWIKFRGRSIPLFPLKHSETKNFLEERDSQRDRERRSERKNREKEKQGR